MGCETVQFYQQAVWGQISLLHARQPVVELSQSASVDPVTRDRLILAQDILGFAEQELGLDQGARYTSFVQLDADYVVWNVFAAPPYSLTGKQWCYPIVGCAPYRGYFKESLARKAARRYARRGLETYVGGVPAYSTLGWFEDPLLSSFIHWPEPDLASLLIHEIAHKRVWVNSDVTFNESFAEFVGFQGARAWLTRNGQYEQWQNWLTRRQGWQRFRGFVVQAKSHLTQVYALQDPVAAKNTALSELQACYRSYRQQLGDGRYDEIMQHSFNNAFLVSVGTYADWLPAFQALFDQHSGDWNAFFDEVERIAALPQESRTALLTAMVDSASLLQEQVAHYADNEDTQEINCQPFLSHGSNGKPSA